MDRVENQLGRNGTQDGQEVHFQNLSRGTSENTGGNSSTLTDSQQEEPVSVTGKPLPQKKYISQKNIGPEKYITFSEQGQFGP